MQAVDPSLNTDERPFLHVSGLRIEVTAMASARITQRWADGTEFEVEVYVDTTFPDALNQVAVEANKLWHEALAEDAES